MKHNTKSETQTEHKWIWRRNAGCGNVSIALILEVTEDRLPHTNEEYSCDKDENILV